MNAEELARKVAQDLKPEFGPEVAASTEAAIRGEQSRGWGEAAHIGAFVLSACRLMWEIYKDYKTTPELRNAVAARLEKKPVRGAWNSASLSSIRIGSAPLRNCIAP